MMVHLQSGRVLRAALTALLFVAVTGAADAGPVKKNVNLFIGDDDSVTFISQGSMDFPGAVGSSANNPHLYLGGWGASGGSTTWTDTNRKPTLLMDSRGLSILNHNGVANENGDITGTPVILTGSIKLGARLRGDQPPGKSSYEDVVFVNGSINFTIKGCVGIGTPNLTVRSASVDNSRLDPGQTFTLSATVRNDGSGTCDTSTLRYYRSRNITISTFDTQIGTASPIGSLGTGETSPVETTANAPATEGVYWVGACVESVVGEKNTTNQCSAGVMIRVGQCGTVDVASQEIGTMKTFQACRVLTAGPSLDITTDLGASLFGGESVGFTNGVTVASDAQLTVGACGHDICDQNLVSPLTSTCMPCVEAICSVDSFCCNTLWDGGCVAQVGSVCGLPCP